MIAMLTVTLLIVGGLGFVKFQQIQTAIAQGAASQPPPEAVTTIVAQQMKNDAGKTYRGVRQQFVKAGPARGDQIAVISGVKPGDEIVTSGVFKLRNRVAILVNNAVQPGNDPAPMVRAVGSDGRDRDLAIFGSRRQSDSDARRDRAAYRPNEREREANRRGLPAPSLELGFSVLLSNDFFDAVHRPLR